MPYLHPASLSPDPLYHHSGTLLPDGQTSLTLYPHRLVRVAPAQAEARAWGKTLHLRHDPGPVSIAPARNGQAEVLLDFGTEVDGVLELTVETPQAGTIYVAFGESVPEAESWGPASTCHGQLPEKEKWDYQPGGGTRRFAARGFRCIRLHCFDLDQPITLRTARVDATFMFQQRRGDFTCSDRRLQQVWQTSAYTARLCTRPDAFWDGIKRDRLGWYGDARITKATVDTVFFDPTPTLPMLLALDPESWANGIPIYSFDAVTMLRQHIESFGTDDPRIREVYGRITALLHWVMESQTAPNGMLTRRDEVDYFFGIGFLDWSPQPYGGRFEELSALQCSYLEALRDAAQIAVWLGETADAARYTAAAAPLQQLIINTFYQPGVGIHHTLNLTDRDPWRMPLNGGHHYRKTYIEQTQLGPSGPSRQSAACAVWAGICDTAMRRDVLQAFLNPALPEIITPYYKYYEMDARAACGDADGALLAMRDYIAPMLEKYDSLTVWESFEPTVTGLNVWSLSAFPKSLCHGWSSGIVSLVTRYLLGVRALAPGFAQVALHPQANLPLTFTATIPTPHGQIVAVRERKGGPVEYDVPSGIEVITPEPARVRVAQ